MRVEITTRFDIEVGDRHDVELVGRRVIERLDEVGAALSGIAVVYKYPEHPHAGAGITIDRQWELVKQGESPMTRVSSRDSPFHPDAVTLLATSGKVAL